MSRASSQKRPKKGRLPPISQLGKSRFGMTFVHRVNTSTYVRIFNPRMREGYTTIYRSIFSMWLKRSFLLYFANMLNPLSMYFYLG